MNNNLANRQYFLSAGNICVARNSLLYSVAGTGVIVTLYDKRRKIGGMSHFLKTKRPDKKCTNANYALPAIIGLIKLLTKEGSRTKDLEAQVFGGSKLLRKNQGFSDSSLTNIKSAFYILKKAKISVAGVDVGFSRGRKVMFNSFTGETIVAKVNDIRLTDWM